MDMNIVEECKLHNSGCSRGEIPCSSSTVIVPTGPHDFCKREQTTGDNDGRADSTSVFGVLPIQKGAASDALPVSKMAALPSVNHSPNQVVHLKTGVFSTGSDGAIPNSPTIKPNVRVSVSGRMVIKGPWKPTPAALSGADLVRRVPSSPPVAHENRALIDTVNFVRGCDPSSIASQMPQSSYSSAESTTPTAHGTVDIMRAKACSHGEAQGSSSHTVRSECIETPKLRQTHGYGSKINLKTAPRPLAPSSSTLKIAEVRTPHSPLSSPQNHVGASDTNLCVSIEEGAGGELQLTQQNYTGADVPMTMPSSTTQIQEGSSDDAKVNNGHKNADSCHKWVGSDAGAMENSTAPERGFVTADAQPPAPSTEKTVCVEGAPTQLAGIDYYEHAFPLSEANRLARGETDGPAASTLSTGLKPAAESFGTVQPHGYSGNGVEAPCIRRLSEGPSHVSFLSSSFLPNPVNDRATPKEGANLVCEAVELISQGSTIREHVANSPRPLRSQSPLMLVVNTVPDHQSSSMKRSMECTKGDAVTSTSRMQPSSLNHSSPPQPCQPLHRDGKGRLDHCPHTPPSPPKKVNRSRRVPVAVRNSNVKIPSLPQNRSPPPLPRRKKSDIECTGRSQRKQRRQFRQRHSRRACRQYRSTPPKCRNLKDFGSDSQSKTLPQLGAPPRNGGVHNLNEGDSRKHSGDRVEHGGNSSSSSLPNANNSPICFSQSQAMDVRRRPSKTPVLSQSGSLESSFSVTWNRRSWSGTSQKQSSTSNSFHKCGGSNESSSLGEQSSEYTNFSHSQPRSSLGSYTRDRSGSSTSGSRTGRDRIKSDRRSGTATRRPKRSDGAIQVQPRHRQPPPPVRGNRKQRGGRGEGACDDHRSLRQRERSGMKGRGIVCDKGNSDGGRLHYRGYRDVPQRLRSDRRHSNRLGKRISRNSRSSSLSYSRGRSRSCCRGYSDASRTDSYTGSETYTMSTCTDSMCNMCTGALPRFSDPTFADTRPSAPFPDALFIDTQARLARTDDIRRYAEQATMYIWSTTVGAWLSRTTYVVIASRPFAHGSMRSSYHILDLEHPSYSFVAKRYRKPNVRSAQYFDDVAMLSVSEYWAKEFNSRGPPKPVAFLPSVVIQLTQRGSGNKTPCLLAMEPYMAGQFSKHNNNNGYVARHARWTPQAFSHFSFHASCGQILIVDIQGVDDVYTDPQILSCDGKGFGRGNLGVSGMRNYIKSHKCNEVCRALELPDYRGSTARAFSLAASAAQETAAFGRRLALPRQERSLKLLSGLSAAPNPGRSLSLKHAQEAVAAAAAASSGVWESDAHDHGGICKSTGGTGRGETGKGRELNGGPKPLEAFQASPFHYRLRGLFQFGGKAEKGKKGSDNANDAGGGSKKKENASFSCSSNGAVGGGARSKDNGAAPSGPPPRPPGLGVPVPSAKQQQSTPSPLEFLPGNVNLSHAAGVRGITERRAARNNSTTRIGPERGENVAAKPLHTTGVVAVGINADSRSAEVQPSIPLPQEEGNRYRDKKKQACDARSELRIIGDKGGVSENGATATDPEVQMSLQGAGKGKKKVVANQSRSISASTGSQYRPQERKAVSVATSAEDSWKGGAEEWNIESRGKATMGGQGMPDGDVPSQPPKKDKCKGRVGNESSSVLSSVTASERLREEVSVRNSLQTAKKASAISIGEDSGNGVLSQCKNAIAVAKKRSRPATTTPAQYSNSASDFYLTEVACLHPESPIQEAELKGGAQDKRHASTRANKKEENRESSMADPTQAHSTIFMLNDNAESSQVDANNSSAPVEHSLCEAGTALAVMLTANAGEREQVGHAVEANAPSNCGVIGVDHKTGISYRGPHLSPCNGRTASTHQLNGATSKDAVGLPRPPIPPPPRTHPFKKTARSSIIWRPPSSRPAFGSPRSPPQTLNAVFDGSPVSGTVACTVGDESNAESSGSSADKRCYMDSRLNHLHRTPNQNTKKLSQHTMGARVGQENSKTDATTATLTGNSTLSEKPNVPPLLSTTIVVPPVRKVKGGGMERGQSGVKPSFFKRRFSFFFGDDDNNSNKHIHNADGREGSEGDPDTPSTLPDADRDWCGGNGFGVPFDPCEEDCLHSYEGSATSPIAVSCSRKGRK